MDLAKCLPAILHHHEHYNGGGYLSGLKGDNIPLEARILSIADAYDAITSPRPYHQQLSSQQALTELRRCAGTQFDPEMVSVFCKMIEQTHPKRLEIK
jgi:HD-GYP domain-containing protein (c-di-GMP phosphodiesterase class II)